MGKKMKIVALFVVMLITVPIFSVAISSVNAHPPIVNEILGLDRRNAIYMLIRSTTWDIRGDQGMDLMMLCNIRTKAETAIGLMTLIPSKNPLLSIWLSVVIFRLALLFSMEDGGNLNHAFELYQQMIVPTREGIITI